MLKAAITNTDFKISCDQHNIKVFPINNQSPCPRKNSLEATQLYNEEQTLKTWGSFIISSCVYISKLLKINVNLKAHVLILAAVNTISSSAGLQGSTAACVGLEVTEEHWLLRCECRQKRTAQKTEIKQNMFQWVFFHRS